MYKSIKRAGLFLLFLMCVLSFEGYSQASDNLHTAFYNKKIEGYYQYGMVLPTNSFITGNNAVNDRIDDYQALSVRLAWQCDGSKLWHHLYHAPQYGIGLYSIQFPETSELGNPVALYGFFKAPFHPRRRLTLGYNIGFGITFGWESWELGENPKNIALGASESVYIDFALNLDYQLSKTWDIGTGVTFTHFSNGGLKKPNSGINTLAPKISFTYAFPQREESNFQTPDLSFTPSNTYSILYFHGWKNVLYHGTDVDSTLANKGVYYTVGGLSFHYHRRLSHKSSLGAGITIGYQGSAFNNIQVMNGALDDQDAPFLDGLEVSIYPSYEWVVNKVTLLIQPAVFVYRQKYDNRTPIAYQRIGLQYHFIKGAFIGVSLHAYNLAVSDYIEWNAGYTF